MRDFGRRSSDHASMQSRRTAIADGLQGAYWKAYYNRGGGDVNSFTANYRRYVQPGRHAAGEIA